MKINLLETTKKCFYCGEPSNTKDHIIPVTYYYSGKKSNRHLTSEYGIDNLVNACRECNSIASNKIFIDKYKKKEYIQERLKIKYKKVINSPYWSEDEIREMGKVMQKEIKLQNLARYWVLNRISYPKELYSNLKLDKELYRYIKDIL